MKRAVAPYIAMDAKDLRTDSIYRERNEFINYEQSDTRSLCSNQNYVDTNAVSKMDIQTSRPYAVIGPDRIVSQPLSNLEFSIKRNYTEWNYKDNSVCAPPDHYEKISKQHPLRNISPRQTYQENMQRVMMPPHIDSMKVSDVPANFISGRNMTKNSTSHMVDPKVIDVPYNVTQTPIEQKNFVSSEMYIPQPTATIIPPHGWTPSNSMPGRTYPQFSPSNVYRYSEYSNHTTSYPVPVPRSHRVVPEETSHMYSNQFYRPGNMRYEPYPSKDRLPPVRYEYINNYPMSCNPRTYTSHKVITPETYTAYNQVPLKYLRTHVNDIPPERFQRPINPMHNFNSAYHSYEFASNYTSAGNANYFPSKITCSNENIIKPKQISKSNNVSKIYPDYDPSLIKHYHQPENMYTNNVMPANHMKESVITNFPSLNIQPMSHLLQYQRNINEVSHFKNGNNLPQFKTMPSDNVNHMARLHPQFSPNTPYLGSSSNLNTISTQNISQEGYTYHNKNAAGKRKSMELSKMLNPDIYETCDSVYNSHTSSNQLNRESNHNKDKPLRNKNIDVRQFLQMWNEGDEENIDDNGTNPPSTSVNFNGHDVSVKLSSNPDQLYVLDLVNVPTEELDKYEHIEKVSKLPDNIKGYNHIELLHQFEKVLGNSNVKYKYLKPDIPTNSNKMFHPTDNKSSERPLSPLDVEAKISQSVIHKEVGCNFEIKPCSPKALTVDIVAPAQIPAIERQIEKVINPHTQSLPLPSARTKNPDNCELVKQHVQQLKLQREESFSCKLTETNGSDILETKANYSLQEFNTNSGVCLASLPRLDNDIDFNFPEVNQQFLDANKIESAVNKFKNTNTVHPVVNETSHKNVLNVGNKLQSSNFNEPNTVAEEMTKHISIDIKSPIPPDCESAKETTKLSKFRKIKNHISNVSDNSLASAKCTDNIIAKMDDRENIPVLEVGTTLDFDKSTNNLLFPINLSSTKSNVIQYATNLNAVQNERKLEKNVPMNEAINLAINSINNEPNNSFDEVMENENVSSECLSKREILKATKYVIQNHAVEEAEVHNSPYVDKCVADSDDSMEINNKTEAEKSDKGEVGTSFAVNLKDEEINVSENVLQLDQNSVSLCKNEFNAKMGLLVGESCFKNISDHCDYDSESKLHQTDKSYNLTCSNKLDFSISCNNSDKNYLRGIFDEKSEKIVDKVVNINPLNLLSDSVNIFSENSNNQETYTHNDTLNYVSSNKNGNSKMTSVLNNNGNVLHPDQKLVNIEKNITEDKIVESDLEKEILINSSCVLKLSEITNSLDLYDDNKTDININKDFQHVEKQFNVDLRSMQDNHNNVSNATKHNTINTNISTDKITDSKQEFNNKNITDHENIAIIIPCSLSFSTENKKMQDKITLLPESNIENPVSKPSPSVSPSIQETQYSIATTVKTISEMNKDIYCRNNITDVNVLPINNLFSNNIIEKNKQEGFINIIATANDMQSQIQSEEIRSKVNEVIFRYTFSKEFFSARVQNLLLNLEGIIEERKKSTPCEISALTCDTKEMCYNKNFKGTESQNSQSSIISCTNTELIKRSQDEVLENVTKDQKCVKEPSNMILKSNSPGTFVVYESFGGTSTLVKIEENNETIVLNNCTKNDDSKISQMSTAIRSNDMKDLVNEKALKCCKCEGSSKNHSTQNSRLIRRKLRSLSESDIYEYDLEFSNDMKSYDKPYMSWPKKTKKDVNFTLDGDNRNLTFPTNCRRNSIASILNDQNVSVCILIDSNCLITDEPLDNDGDNECYSFGDEEIVCSNEEPVSTTVLVPIENNNIQEEAIQNLEADIYVDKEYGDFWVDDVGCIETVVSDEIIESNDNSLSILDTETDVSVEPLEAMPSKKFDSAKIRAIYGSNILKSDIKLVESLYKTPQMNVKDKLKKTTKSPIQIEEDNKLINLYDHAKTSFNISNFNRISEISDKGIRNESESLTLNDLDIDRKKNSDNQTVTIIKHRKETLNSLSTTVDKHLTYSEDDYESDSSTLFTNQRSTLSMETHINVSHTLKISSPICKNSFDGSASSSPEVSSTTSEEKSNILLKICKYETSKASCIKLENESELFKKGLRCKLTEANHYAKSGHSNTASKPLITKAAQKYIPPPKTTNNNLKVKLPLPEYSLQKLKQLKMSKDIPKSKKKNIISNKEMEPNKKMKPNFEDVLKSIDEVQYKLHKSKCKMKQTIPKVIIKKNENGSHYASTSKIYNPDLTGRKWQPWVFLEKNYFIDKMAVKKNTKAIYCHKRNTYIITDKIENNRKVEPNGTSTKLVISRPKGNLLKVPLKYTVRWKHPY